MTDNDFVNVRLSDDGRAVVIIDQTLLPCEIKYLTLNTPGQLHEAIYMLRVRGAPAIGIFAAYALYVLAAQIETDSIREFTEKVSQHAAYLGSSRPTAVNLETQLRRMTAVVSEYAQESRRGDDCSISSNSRGGIPAILKAMKSEALQIHNEDIEMCRRISEHGLTLIRDGSAVLTQCNAGPLATSKYGTGLGPLILGREKGMKLSAYVCETRPLLQGARLTAFELDSFGIDCTLICDNMANVVMGEGKIDAVFTGCDRVAANGDVANKVGTCALAILAKHYNIPFYVFGPSTTIDLDCPTGADIEIEQREPSEIKRLYFEKPVAPDSVRCYNPAFDVTPAELITAIITETGIHRPADIAAKHSLAT